MSRHRDIRNMDYSEDYDGYDDVYGHSVDDDYYISPSHRQFIFNRENSRDQPKIGEYIQTEQDIQEEDESELAPELSDLEKAKLESCIEQIKITLGSLNISKNELANIIISHNFNVEKATDVILNRCEPSDRKEKGVTNVSLKFGIPKLNGLKTSNPSPFISKENLKEKKFTVPSLSKLPSNKFIIPKLKSEENVPSKTFTVPKIGNFVQKQSDNLPGKSIKFNNLSDLVSNHLSKSLQNNLNIDSTTKHIIKTSENIKNLSIVEPTQTLENKTVNEYQIDLSVALKTSLIGQSINSKSKHELKEEKFEIPYIDCDADLQTETALKCAFDVKDVLKIYIQNVKPASNFGKVLCLKFRRRKRHRLPLQKNDFALSKLPRFNFTIPSPDDNIMKHLKT